MDHHTRRAWQGLLIAEAALAAAERDCGLVPAPAAAAIIAAADIDVIDGERLVSEHARTRHAVMPVIRALAAACPDEAAGWVHWGATTQNIVHSAEMLELRGFQRWLLPAWAALMDRLSELAAEHRDTVCAGRSHGQQAVPTSFGHVVAAWLEEAAAVGRELQAAGDEVLRAQFGGAVGTLAALDDHGPAVMAAFARHLALPPEPFPDRCGHQGVTRYVLALGRLGSLSVRLATDCMLAMRTEQGELGEGFAAGVIGSSTMPQKVNPKDSQDALAIGHRLAHAAALQLTHPPAWEQGDRGVRSLLHANLGDCRDLTVRLLPVLQRLFDHLRVDPAAMRANLERAGLWCLSERVMLALGRRWGRQVAHERLHDLAELAGSHSLPAALAARFGGELDAETIAELCDPAGYLGAAGILVDDCRERAAATAGALRGWAHTPLTAPEPLIQARLSALTAAAEAACRD